MGICKSPIFMLTKRQNGHILYANNSLYSDNPRYEVIAMERIMITIPADLLKDVDSVAQDLKQNRSQLIRQALTDLIRRTRQQEFEELLAEGYMAVSQENSEIVSESLSVQSAAVEEIWEWDDE
jgi:predicted transcriptional regulator